MARHAFAQRAIAFFGLLLLACEGPAAIPIAPLDPIDAALQALDADTGQTWALRRNPYLHTPAWLEGRTAPMAATPSDADRAARAFLSRYHALFQMGSPDELATVSSVTDEMGMTHTRYAQRNGRIPILGGDLAVHFDSSGALVRVNGRYAPIVAPASLLPIVTTDAARVQGASLAREARPWSGDSQVTTQAPELVLFPIEDGELAPGQARAARLAWRVRVDVDDTDQPLQLDAIFAADDGQLLTSLDRIQTLDGSGVGVFGDRKPLVVEQKKTAYWLEDRSRSTTSLRTFSAALRDALPGTELRSTDPERWDEGQIGVAGAAVDAHAHLATSWDYFERVHGRSGWDGKGTGLRAIVHYGDAYANAFFDGVQLVFGDGDERMSPPSAALDIVGHEYTHGVIAATAALDPVGEPGAINEGLSDLFGCLVAWSSGQGGRWQIGETIFHPNGTNQPMRDLADPHSTGQPANLSELQSGDDPQSAHTNASIVGHLGYLLVEGDVAHDITPLGDQIVGRIFYRAMTAYLFPRAGFLDLGDALVAAARDLGEGAEPSVDAALAVLGIR